MPQTISASDVLNFKRNATLRQIEIICTVAQVGSMTETAAILQMSVPNVSRTCNRFEGHFNFPIFEKKYRGVVLSPRGKIIVNELRPLLDCIEMTLDRLMVGFAVPE